MTATVTREFAEAVAVALSAKVGEPFVALPGLFVGPDFRPLDCPAKPDHGEPSDAEFAAERGIWMLCGKGVAVEISASREYAKRGRIAYSAEIPRSPEGWSAYALNVLGYDEARADNGTVSGDCTPARLASAIAKALPSCRLYTDRALKSYQDRRERENAEAEAGRRLARAARFSPAEEDRAVDREAPLYRAKLNLRTLPGSAYGDASFENGYIALDLRGLPLDKAEAVLDLLTRD